MKIKYNKHEIEIGEYFKKIINIDNNQKHEISLYEYVIDESEGFMQIQTINKKYSMPFNDKELLINDVYKNIEENEGIIDLNTGLTKDNNYYSYYIIKSCTNNKDTVYYLNIQINYNDEIIDIFASFRNGKFNDQRKNIIYDAVKRQINNINPWDFLPYQNNKLLKDTSLMNQSEKEEYDVLFPYNALSMARKLVNNIIY